MSEAKLDNREVRTIADASNFGQDGPCTDTAVEGLDGRGDLSTADHLLSLLSTRDKQFQETITDNHIFLLELVSKQLFRPCADLADVDVQAGWERGSWKCPCRGSSKLYGSLFL